MPSSMCRCVLIRTYGHVHSTSYPPVSEGSGIHIALAALADEVESSYVAAYRCGQDVP